MGLQKNIRRLGQILCGDGRCLANPRLGESQANLLLGVVKLSFSGKHPRDRQPRLYFLRVWRNQGARESFHGGITVAQC